jgi:hypothetical protein
MDTKKKNVSLRVSPNDMDKIRHIADRLGVKESEVLRFSVKQMLTHLAPFQEASFRGVDLMPALLEIGQDMVRFFEFSVEQLDRIVNRGVDDGGRRIDQEDLKLLALSGMNGRYAQLKLQSEAHPEVTDEDSFNRYFMDKYFSADRNDGQEGREGQEEAPKVPWERMPETTRPVTAVAGLGEPRLLPPGAQRKTA